MFNDTIMCGWYKERYGLGKMNDKLKDGILRLTNRLIVSLMIVVGMACCGSLAVYGAEEGLTEEEVKQQVVEILEAEGEDGEYDIDKIYQIVTLDYFVNDYIDGKSFKEIIETAKIKEIGEDNVRYSYWLLPYENSKCFLIFVSDDKNVEKVTKTVGAEMNYDMRLYEGKNEKIDLECVEEVTYLDLDLYGFKVVYIREYDGNEYIVPYLNDRIESWSNLESEKVYIIDEFIKILYNCYKEPNGITKKDEMKNLSLLIQVRKKKLNYNSLEQIRNIEILKENKVELMMTAFFVVLVIYIMLYKIKKRKASD